MIKISIEQLERVVKDMKDRYRHQCKENYVYATIEKYLNGKEYLNLEQPSVYPECTSNGYHFDGKVL